MDAKHTCEQFDAAAQIEWLEKANTLHRQVDILYVVDGYQVTVTWDGCAISDSFHGETVAEAIGKAMVGFDLDAKPQFTMRPDLEPHERQMDALVKQRDDLLTTARQVMAWWEEHQYDTTGHRGEYNLYSKEPEFVASARAAIAKASGVDG